MKVQFSLWPASVLAAMLVLPAYASAQAVDAAQKAQAADPGGAPPDALPGHFAEERYSSTSEVVAVDPAARTVTLREEGEEPQTFTLGKEVRNLDQVKPGDRVKVDVYAATSIRILPPGELVNDDAATIERSQPGEKPGGLAARKRTETVTISSVFPEAKEFLTRNAKGRLRTWKVRDAKQLENIKSGERIQLTYASALAISVTPAPPKPTTTTGPTTAAATPAAEPKTPAPAPAAPATPGS